ncbi:helix-turn-helix domain-containing protein [Yersinia massiliensis]|uniref:helix-turn-helix domain-containing protein n=1 Tax=Yersinia massiliensis TaxID=419257 RepID=UPI0005B6276B|nr:helix-turn-helix domain-containing protein [Yersinia massiliensis]
MIGQHDNDDSAVRCNSVDPLNSVQQVARCLSLQDQLVLAIPTNKSGTLTFRSRYSGKEFAITQSSLFICDSLMGNQDHWFVESITLAHLIEIIATIDSALGKSLLRNTENETSASLAWPEFIFVEPADYSAKLSINNIVTDLMLRHQAEFNIWCQSLRKYEAYGMMSFLLSSSEQVNNVSISYLSGRYGVSAAYFRYLYKQSFNNTAKKKMMSVRMASAVLRLIESEASILNIGLDAGYCSASHFTNDIKKELGLTPSEIRRLEAMLHEI